MRVAKKRIIVRHPKADDEAASESVKERELRLQVAQWKRLAADKTLEADFFQRCLAQNRGATPEQHETWRDGIYDQIRGLMLMQGNLSIERMCQLAGVSRAGFYRSLQEHKPAEEDMEVRSAIGRSLLNTSAATAVVGRARNCAAAGCLLITSAWHG